MTHATGTNRTPAAFSSVVHDSYDTSFTSAGHVATCVCGWSSPPSLSSGMAGALWDEHVQRTIRPAAA